MVVPPELLVPNVTRVVRTPLHNTWSAGLFTWPAGFTVIENVLAVPTQDVPPFVYVGVTVIIPEMGAVEVLDAVKEILPVPLAAKPMAVLSLAQAYVVFPAGVFTVAKVTVVKAP